MKNNVGVQVGIGLASGAGVAIIVAFLIRHVFMPKAEAMFRERMEKGEIVAVSPWGAGTGPLHLHTHLRGTCVPTVAHALPHPFGTDVGCSL